jgi:hypothetical protein
LERGYYLGLQKNVETFSLFFEKPRIIADNLSKAGWSLGIVSAIDCEGPTIWIADAQATESVSLCEQMKS